MPTGPVPTVEMTFQESSRYALSSSRAIDNWQELDGNEYGVGYQFVGPYRHRYLSTVHHSLHCIHVLATDARQSSIPHWEHCLMYIRQVFICNADVTLEPGDFLQRNLTFDRQGVTRQCKDWKMVDDWMNTKFRELLKLNEVFDTLSPA